MFSMRFLVPASRQEWADFMIAVTDVYWSLPKSARPPGMKRASGLFTNDVLHLFPQDGGFCATVSALILAPGGITAHKKDEHDIGLQILKLTDKRDAFFARIVFVLLRKYCPDYADIHISDDSAGCELPVLWLKHHLGLSGLYIKDLDQQIMADASVCIHVEQYGSSADAKQADYHWEIFCRTDEILRHRRHAKSQLKKTGFSEDSCLKSCTEIVERPVYLKLLEKMNRMIADFTSPENADQQWLKMAYQLFNETLFVVCRNADSEKKEESAFRHAQIQLKTCIADTVRFYNTH